MSVANKWSRKVILAAAVGSVSIGTASLTRQAHAAPYAAGVTVVGSTVSFTLNENADALQFRIDGGPLQTLTATKGAKTFDLGTGLTFDIIATKANAVGYSGLTGAATGPTGSSFGAVIPTGGLSVLTDDTAAINLFNSPRGVAVNTNPNAGASFGTAYVANSVAGTRAASVAPQPVGPARTLTGDGFFAIGPAQTDVLGQGDAARDGGITAWTAVASANAPYRISVGPDNKLYASDFSDATGTVWRLDADLTNGANVFANKNLAGSNVSPSALPALQNHGSSNGVYVEGTGANLKVYTLDEDLTSAQVNEGVGLTTDNTSIWRYDVGTSASGYDGTPTRVNTNPNILLNLSVGVGSVTTDFDRGADGKFYAAQNRSAGETNGLVILDAGGNTIFTSQSAARTQLGNTTSPDIFSNILGLAVSPDQQWLAFILNNSDVGIVPLVSGIPDISKIRVVDTGADINSGRDISFDAANNIHYVTSGRGRYSILSVGGTTEATTSYTGSAFTFSKTQTAINTVNKYDGTTGLFNDATKWSSGTAPATGSIAQLSLATGPQTVTIPSNITLSALTIGDTVTSTASGAYTIDSTGGTITFDGSTSTSATALLSVLNGPSHAITAPIALNSALAVNVQNGGTLTLSSIAAAANRSLSITGQGSTVIVPTNNTGFLAPVTISVGATLQLGTGGATGSFGPAVTYANTGTLNFNSTTDYTQSGVISSTGVIIKDGPNTVSFTGANTSSGRLIVLNGRVNIGIGGNAGSFSTLTNITNNAGGTVVINRITTDLTMAAVFSGAGTLVKEAANTVTFTAASQSPAFTGPTFLNAGALRFGNGSVTATGGNGALRASPITTASGTVVIFNPLNSMNATGTAIVGAVGTISYTSVISGAGGVNVVLAPAVGAAGTPTAGIAIISGNSTYTGPTNIAATTTLQIGAGGATGAIGSGLVTNNALLAFNRTGTLNVAAPIAGTGRLIQRGVGTVTLDGVLTYTGNTSLTGNQGGLVLNQALRTPASSLTVTGTQSTAILAAPAAVTNVVAGEFSTITASNGAVVRLATTDRSLFKARVLISGPLSIGGASIDLTNNDAIFKGTSLAAVSALYSGWYNLGTFTGTGLISTAASANPLTTLAIVSNDDGNGNRLRATFAGQDVAASDILVKYTYLGDTDLDGDVTTTDLGNLIKAIRNGGTGSWINGDTNYDGLVDGLDYANLVTALRNKSVVFDDVVDSSGVGTGAGVIPEPGSAMLLFACAPLLRRRSR